jgi:alpha-tubulin suppressor-like RCC1 family protein
MATIDIGKIRFTWKSAWVNTTAYSQNDAVSYNGSSWIAKIDQTASAYDAVTVYSSGDLASDGGVVYRFINVTPTAGQQPSASVGYWSTNEPTSTNTVYWDIVAEGTNILTTQGDLMTHDGTNATRLARGNNGEVLTVSGSDVTFSPLDALSGRKYLLPNYDQVVHHNAATTYGASGSTAWLADYANNWIPESGIMNPKMGPIMFQDKLTGYGGGYRSYAYLNQNHEVVLSGTDGYRVMGSSGGNTHRRGITTNISHEFGGLKDGEYFVRIWYQYYNLYVMTNKGGLFAAGYNGHGQLGVGDTVDRYNLVRVPAFGEGRTHNGTGSRLCGFWVQGGGEGSGQEHACYAIDEQGRLFVWGQNRQGMLGNGNSTNQSRPQEITAMSNVRQIETGYHSCLAVDGNKNVFGTGYNTSGHLAGIVATSSAVNSWTQISGATNAYQIINNNNQYYAGGWTYVGSSYYLNESGELYSAGYGGNDALGTGSTANINAYARIGGSTTYSQIYAHGQSRDFVGVVIGGTPSVPDKNIYLWGDNGNAQLGNGTATNSSSPIQPSTTMLYTNTTASTAADSAPTSTSLTFPRTDIVKVWPQSGILGQTTSHIYCEDSNGNLYVNGYSNGFTYYQNNHNDTNVLNFRQDVSPMSTPETTTSNFWVGESSRSVVAIITMGYSYNSEGCSFCFMSDGTILVRGYNGVGTIESSDNYVESWMQLN